MTEYLKRNQNQEKKMPELKYGNTVNYKTITDMEDYYNNSENKQNRASDEQQGVKTDKKHSD